MRKVSLKRKRAEKDATAATTDGNDSDGAASAHNDSGDTYKSAEGDEDAGTARTHGDDNDNDADAAGDVDAEGGGGSENGDAASTGVKNDKNDTTANGDDDDEEVVVPAKKPKKRRGRKGAKKPKIPKPPIDLGDEELEDEEPEKEYEVEAVVNHKTVRGKLQYLIKWKGYDEDGNTWEDEDSLNCAALIAKYRKTAENGAISSSSSSKKKQASPKKGGNKRKAADDEDDDKEWEVEKILDVAQSKTGKLFHVHWKGYAKKHDSWEPEENLNCSDLIEKFMKKMDHVATQSRDMRGKRPTIRRYAEVATKPGKRSSRRRPNRERAVYYDAESDN